MKRAVITGATSGIASKTAEILGLSRYEVLFTGTNKARGESVLYDLRSMGNRLRCPP